MTAGLKRIDHARGHSYELDGKPCPGVTTLIGKGIPKPALMHWAARVVAEHVYSLDDATVLSMKHASPEFTVNTWKKVPFQQRDQAADRGTEVHKFAERLVKGWDVDVPIHLEGYVASAVQFMKEWRVAPVLVEAMVGSRSHNYCGTVDLICDLPDGRRALMDYKTAKSGIFPEAAIQLAAYRNAEFVVGKDDQEFPLHKLGINCTYAIWLREDGYDVYPLHSGPEVFECFLSAATTGRFVDVMKSWVGQAEAWKAVA